MNILPEVLIAISTFTGGVVEPVNVSTAPPVGISVVETADNVVWGEPSSFTDPETKEDVTRDLNTPNTLTGPWACKVGDQVVILSGDIPLPMPDHCEVVTSPEQFEGDYVG